jgi:hypothetical protein
MLSKLLKTYLILTSLAPLCISVSYIFYEKYGLSISDFIPLAIMIIVGWSSLYILRFAASSFELFNEITIAKIKSIDKEVIGFLIAYSLPLLLLNVNNIKIHTLFFIIVVFILIFGLVIWGTHSFQVNPLLGIFGFHFYEIETENGITLMLITKEEIIKAKHIKQIVKLTEDVILEVKK